MVLHLLVSISFLRFRQVRHAARAIAVFCAYALLAAHLYSAATLHHTLFALSCSVMVLRNATARITARCIGNGCGEGRKVLSRRCCNIKVESNSYLRRHGLLANAFRHLVRHIDNA